MVVVRGVERAVFGTGRRGIEVATPRSPSIMRFVAGSSSPASGIVHGE